MNINNAKTPRQQLVRQCNRAGFKMVLKLFFPVVAGGWLLLADVGVSKGGCIDDPGKFSSLGYLFERNPSFHRRHDDASGTFCAPCYGYHPTCWQQWPDCCVGYSALPVSASAVPPVAPLQSSPPAELTSPAEIPATKLPPPPSQPGSVPSIPSPPAATPAPAVGR